MAAINASTVRVHVGFAGTTTAPTDATSLNGTYYYPTGQTSANISFSKETIDVTTKQNNGRADYLSGQKSATLTLDGLVDLTTTGNRTLTAPDDETATITQITIKELLALHQLRRKVAVRLTDETWNNTSPNTFVGGNRFEAYGIVTEVSLDAPLEEAKTYSLTIQLKGQVFRKNNDTATT